MYSSLFLFKLLFVACALLLTLASAVTVSSTILVIARDAASAASGSYGLSTHNVPFEVLLVPQAGIQLPTLNNSTTNGNYGGIIVMSEVQYEYSTGWASAITTAQWQTLYSYQSDFGVRMVRFDVYPTADFGVETAIDGSGCCDSGVEQLVSFNDTSAFPTANLTIGAGVSTQGLWHYPANITNSTLATPIAQFAAGGPYTGPSTAAVINNFGSREQMVWFITWETSWSATSKYLQDAPIYWITRGIFGESPSNPGSPAASITVSSTILVFARDIASSISGTSGLNAYGIPFELVLVPQGGITLPTLNSSTTAGNYGGIIVLSEVSYDYSSGWASALTSAQWQTLFTYQSAFNVRMTRIDVYPSSEFGVETTISGAGCCDSGVEQLISFSDISAFPTSNIKVGAGVTTKGLWHYPATITNSALAVEIAQFGAGGPFTSPSTAAVINNIGNREQMVWFISFATDWSPTSNFLQHAHIHWLTRGLFVGHRRIYFNSQVDDVHLSTDLYQPANTKFRIRTSDFEAHVTWQADLNSRLPSGSSYIIELAHNGNGNIEAAVAADTTGECIPPSSINLLSTPPATAPEFQKPLGSGTDLWPSSPLNYTWTLACTKLDPIGAWFQVTANRDKYAHLSHTFTHEALNNATTFDANLQIIFNQAWLEQVGIAAGKFSSHGLVPPAITGLHNGDVIASWISNGITIVVGDNTRPVLLNSENEHWPLITTVAANGYAGLTIMPRWSTPIYYNCYSADCTLAEWIDTSGGSGDFNALLDFSRSSYTHHLLGLRHDPFMFHQANLRQGDTDTFTVGSVSGQLSLLQIFVETVLQEMMRLTTWPIITKTHDDLGQAFIDRMTLDNCAPKLTYIYSEDNTQITGVTVGATDNTCSVPVPVQFPGAATTTSSGVTDEQLGSDPLTKWTTLSGSAVTFTLSSPIAV